MCHCNDMIIYHGALVFFRLISSKTLSIRITLMCDLYLLAAHFYSNTGVCRGVNFSYFCSKT